MDVLLQHLDPSSAGSLFPQGTLAISLSTHKMGNVLIAEVLQLPGFTPRVRHAEVWKNTLQEYLEASKVGPDDPKVFCNLDDPMVC